MRKPALLLIFSAVSIIAIVLLVALVSVKGDGKESVVQRAGKAIKTFAESEPEKDLQLPDIIVTKPRQIYISRQGDQKTLRFSTTFINQGEGPIELFGHSDKETELTYATQYIKEKGGPGIYRNIGEFEFHPTHTHWHLEDYVYYQLIPIESPDETPIRQTDKMSFCIWDEDNERLELEAAAKTRVYPRNCNGRIQGMSVGWSDTYAANVDGQEIDITDVPNGRYIFRSIVNPDQKIMELNQENNTSEVIIEIIGNTLTVE